jgi:hypothetical protein
VVVEIRKPFRLVQVALFKSQVSYELSHQSKMILTERDGEGIVLVGGEGDGPLAPDHKPTSGA